MEVKKINNVVIIGASAGGLQPIQSFFSTVEKNSCYTYFLMQHRSEDHGVLMDKIIERETTINVNVAYDGMFIKPGEIYILPSRKQVGLFKNRVLFFEEISEDMPIDFLMKSCAHEYGDKSIGVILSGTGQDGLLGSLAINNVGGSIFTQSESTASFNSMPRKINQNCDVVASTNSNQLYEKIKKNTSTICEDEKKEYLGYASFQGLKVLYLIREYLNIDADFIKEKILLNRMEVRMDLLNLKDKEDYIRYLIKKPHEIYSLLKNIFNFNHSFSLNDFFSKLEQVAFKEVKGNKKEIRFWLINSSYGVTPYIFAIKIINYFKEKKIKLKLKIFVTNFHEQLYQDSREGVFSEEEMQDIPSTIRDNYFIYVNKAYRIKDEIKDTIVFAKHDILLDPPFSRIDILCAMHLFKIYRQELIKPLFQRLSYAVERKGILALGKGFTTNQAFKNFNLLEDTYNILKKINGSDDLINEEYNFIRKAKHTPLTPVSHLDYEKNLFLEIIKHKVYKGFIINESFDILRTINDVNDFISFKNHRFSKNIFDYLLSDISSVLKRSFDSIDRVNTNYHKSVFKLSTTNKKYILSLWAVHVVSKLFYIVEIKPIQLSALTNESSPLLEPIIKNNNEISLSYNHSHPPIKKRMFNEESRNILIHDKEKLEAFNQELYSINEEYQRALKKKNDNLEYQKELLGNECIEGFILNQHLEIIYMTDALHEYTTFIQKDIGRPIDHLNGLPYYPDFKEDVKIFLKNKQLIFNSFEFHNKRIDITIDKSKKQNKDWVIITLRIK